MPTTLEVLQGLVGKKLTEVRESPSGGLYLHFEGGVVLWWKR